MIKKLFIAISIFAVLFGSPVLANRVYINFNADKSYYSDTAEKFQKILEAALIGRGFSRTIDRVECYQIAQTNLSNAEEGIPAKSVIETKRIDYLLKGNVSSSMYNNYDAHCEWYEVSSSNDISLLKKVSISFNAKNSADQAQTLLEAILYQKYGVVQHISASDDFSVKKEIEKSGDAGPPKLRPEFKVKAASEKMQKLLESAQNSYSPAEALKKYKMAEQEYTANFDLYTEADIELIRELKKRAYKALIYEEIEKGDRSLLKKDYEMARSRYAFANMTYRQNISYFEEGQEVERLIRDRNLIVSMSLANGLIEKANGLYYEMQFENAHNIYMQAADTLRESPIYYEIESRYLRSAALSETERRYLAMIKYCSEKAPTAAKMPGQLLINKIRGLYENAVILKGRGKVKEAELIQSNTRELLNESAAEGFVRIETEKLYNEMEKVVSPSAIDGALEIALAKIPGGTFMMGSSKEEDERPPHEVGLSAFSMGVYEISYSQWQGIKSFANKNGYRFENEGGMGAEVGKIVMHSPKEPVTGISRYDAILACNALSEMTGRTPVYYSSFEILRKSPADPSAVTARIKSGGFALPSEAQWEYAARAGSTNAYYWGDEFDDDYAWSRSSSEDGGSLRSMPVGSKEENGFGLFDMSGSVWEWCYDYYGKDYYESSEYENPRGPKSGKYGVLRGGSFYSAEKELRSANRRFDEHEAADYDYGFRVVINY